MRTLVTLIVLVVFLATLAVAMAPVALGAPVRRGPPFEATSASFFVSASNRSAL